MKWTVGLVVMLIFVSSVLPEAGSQSQVTGEAVTVVSHVDIIPDAYRPGAQEHAGQLFLRESEASQKDAGVVSYVVLQETGLPNHITIVEVWRSAHAYELHVGSGHTVKFRKEIQPLIGSPFDSRVYRRLL